jgi:hypothetical protein
VRGESAFSVRADDWRRFRYGPPDGTIDYLALFLSAFSAPKQPRHLLASKPRNDGHFLTDSADAVQLWAPIVSEFLAKHQ